MFNTSLEDLQGEVWKVIEGYNGKYEVYNMGRVKTYGKFGKIDKSKVSFIKPSNDGKNYYQVRLTTKGKTTHFRLHRLVAEYFLENPNNYPYINHKDGCKSHNWVDNLEYCTPRQNSIHSQETGLQGKRRFTFEMAEEIRKLKNEGMREAEIAKLYNTDYHYIRRIVIGAKWSNNYIKTNNAKITEETVISIKRKLKEYFSVKEVAMLFNVKYNLVYNIKIGKTWTHIKID